METSADEVELNCFSKASHCRVSNQFLLYNMPHILIRINNLHDKQLNNYSSLYRVSLLKSMECGDAGTGKEICNETVGGWHAYTCIAIPCSSQRCEGNYSGETSLSAGWFDFAGSRLAGMKGRVGELWKGPAAGAPAPALHWVQAGVWKQQHQEVLVPPGSLPGAGIQHQLCVLELCHTTACSSSPFPLPHASAGGRGACVAQREPGTRSKSRLKRELIYTQILSKEQVQPEAQLSFIKDCHCLALLGCQS